MAMPFVSVPHGIVINQQVWDKLPGNVKAAFDELGGAAGTQLFGAAFDQANESISAEFLKLEGREITQVTDEQKAAWEAAVKPMWDGWVKAMDEKGFKGQAIIDEFRAYVAENSK
jgi:TRAP-type C4-dicarboxylate transport system substrate-binding protein